MSLLDSDSVLLLGAGASAQFGLPLGGPLMELLSKQLKQEGFDKETGTFDVELLQEPKLFLQKPLRTTLLGLAAVDGQLKFPQFADWGQKAKQLFSLLDGQTSETIDSFVSENPSVAGLTKALVGALFVKEHYLSDTQNALALKDFAGRGFVRQYRDERNIVQKLKERNWTHHLINLVRHHVRDKGNAQIKIVTFNYDNVLEFVLEQQFSNTEITLPHWQKCFDIQHVHGSFGMPPPRCENPAELAIQWGECIQVVREKEVTEEVCQARAAALEHLRNAGRIYAIGFAFAGQNVRLLELDKATSSGKRRWLNYLNYDGSAGVRLAAGRLRQDGMEVEEVASGTVERPIAIQDFFAAGYLGKMPS